MLIFCDFDGVLHPTAGKSSVDSDRYLFCHVENLASILDGRSEVELVISSSWRNAYSLEGLVDLLGPLGALVVGTTGAKQKTRFQEIASWLKTHRYEGPWLAIDDDGEGWPANLAHHLVLCQGEVGLEGDSLDRLRDLLDAG